MAYPSLEGVSMTLKRDIFIHARSCLESSLDAYEDSIKDLPERTQGFYRGLHSAFGLSAQWIFNAILQADEHELRVYGKVRE